MAYQNGEQRLMNEADGSASARVQHGYKVVLGREPSAKERDHALSYLRTNQPAELEGFAWMLLNLSEFVFLP
jgi:hypothetical protein